MLVRKEQRLIKKVGTESCTRFECHYSIHHNIVIDTVQPNPVD